MRAVPERHLQVVELERERTALLQEKAYVVSRLERKRDEALAGVLRAHERWNVVMLIL